MFYYSFDDLASSITVYMAEDYEISPTFGKLMALVFENAQVNGIAVTRHKLQSAMLMPDQAPADLYYNFYHERDRPRYENTLARMREQAEWLFDLNEMNTLPLLTCTLFRSPVDHPGKIVMREHYVLRNGVIIPGLLYSFGKDTAEVFERAITYIEERYYGSVKTMPGPGEHPSIAFVWI